MVPRLLTRIALLSAAYCVLTTPALSQTPPTRSDDVVRVNAALVQTDFMVFDKQGNFIDGLKRDQFVLKVEGKPRDFTFFDRIASGSRSEEAQLAAARGNATSDGTKGSPVPLDRGRTIMFFLDDYHLSPGSMGQVRTLLRSFINREMRQNDRAAIVSASGQIGFLQQLTDNKAVIMSAMERLRSQQSMALNTAEYPPMSEYHAFQVQQHDLDVLNFFVDALVKENPMLPRQTAAEMVRARASQLLEDSSSITTRTLAGFKSFIDSTATLANRKVVFFISDGFLIDRSNSDNFDRIQRISAAAARSGTVIYSIDARGLATGLPEASMLGPADPTGRLSRGGAGELRAFQDGINAMASDTGGRLFLNTNSLSGAVTTALKETSIYYLLAWRPENEEQRNPKFRRIEVSIVGRPDLVVRFRRGFGEPPSDDGAKRTKESASLPVRKTPNEEINAALRAPYPITSLPISIALTFLDTHQYGGTLTTSIKIETSALGLERQGEVPTAVLDVAGLVLNDQGKSVSAFNKRVTIRANSKGVLGQLPETFFYNHISLIKPGLYQVRVAAIDVKQGTRGTSHQWIEVPDLQTKGLTMSSLVVGERKAEADIEPVNADITEPQAPAAIRQVSMNVDHRFARSSYLRFLTFIYNAMTSSTPTLQSQDARGNTVPASIGKPVHDLAVQVQIFRDNEPVITTPLHKIQTEGTFDAQRVPYAADVKLDNLQPGAYVLQVTIIDRLGKSSASQKLSFYIE
jgi:VWFA-related protein